MDTQLKVLDWCIKFFARIRLNANNIVNELLFRKYELLFGERDEDIYVATYMKSGTTWMQMILYQLTTSGDTHFKHIYDVAPWLRNLAETEGKIMDLPSPQIIKTHDAYHRIAKGKKGRFIYVIRDCRDMALSFYHQRKNYNLPELTIKENFNYVFRDKDELNWFEFNKHWLANKNKHAILYVRYEDLQNDFEKELNRLADFIGVKIDPGVLPRIKERCSFTFMKAHETKFGDQPAEDPVKPVFDQFIRSGKVGEGNLAMTDEELQYVRDRIKELSDFPVMKDYLASIETEIAQRRK